MEQYKQLLLANRAWVKDQESINPKFFEQFDGDQNPDYFWIGCSDSRVPADDVTGTEPGELFVHRNIANMVIHTDFNMLSVLQYAVDILHVKHIIVCGHYGCGGIRNALSNSNLGLLNKWLRHIKDVYRFYQVELDAITDLEARAHRLAELNVKEQVHNLAETSIVQRSWHEHRRPMIHGWIYDMRTGLLKELVRQIPGSKIEDIYMFEFDKY